ncbi:DNA-damage-repair/toleration protein DRT111 [Diplonema papillatum]|nr:DNA-damage-repair/toleration protein DRT111 [Diplonema papillatum]
MILLLVLRQYFESVQYLLPNPPSQEQQEEAIRQQQRNEEEERRQWELKEKQRVEALKPTEDSLQLSADEAFKRRLMMSKDMGSKAAEILEEEEEKERDAEARLKAEAERKVSFAERMLKKQGWVEGKGLGRNDQGMAVPLAVFKTAANQGVIKQAEGPVQTGGPKKKGNTKKGKPSKVLLLRNMVPPGSVDGSLESEVAGECQRYGEIKSVQIYEEKADSIAKELRVRIFVKFERIPEAMKAVVELDGRTFDSRVISACFYDEAKYDLSILETQDDDPSLPQECFAPKD